MREVKKKRKVTPQQEDKLSVQAYLALLQSPSLSLTAGSYLKLNESQKK
jgi:hypothetical protein